MCYHRQNTIIQLFSTIFKKDAIRQVPLGHGVTFNSIVWSCLIETQLIILHCTNDRSSLIATYSLAEMGPIARKDGSSHAWTIKLDERETLPAATRGKINMFSLVLLHYLTHISTWEAETLLSVPLTNFPGYCVSPLTIHNPNHIYQIYTGIEASINTWPNNSYNQQKKILIDSMYKSSQVCSEICCCSNQPRTRQQGHLHRPPLRPPAICGLVWADSLVPLALQRDAPPVLFNYLHDGVSPPPPTPSAEPLCSLCQGHPGHMTSNTLTCLVDNGITSMLCIL